MLNSCPQYQIFSSMAWEATHHFPVPAFSIQNIIMDVRFELYIDFDIKLFLSDTLTQTFHMALEDL